MNRNGRRKGSKNDVRYTITCEWCGVRVKRARPEALTCSNAHRLRWARWCRKVREAGKGEAVIGPRGDYRKQFFLAYSPAKV